MLSPRRRKFVSEYVKNGFNGVQAVYAAGYKQGYDSACTEAWRLLRNAEVRKRVEKAIMDAKISADEVLQELSGIARTPLNNYSENAKLKALELSGKALKLFVDRTETTDTSSKDAHESALLKSIQLAAKRDDLSPESAAIQLFAALKDDPQLSDVNTWPAEYRVAIQQSQQIEQTIEIGDQ